MNVAEDAIGTAIGASAEHVAGLVADHYERRGRHLWGLARRLGATDEQARDVVQEAHLRLWRQLTSGSQIDDVDAWVFRVAYRLVMDHHRLSRRVQQLAGRLLDRPRTATLAVDDALTLWPMVDRLPARERATLYLRYRADLSFEQVGAVMGITPGAARTYASRGVERLRVQLTAEEGGRHG
jgi:RNA polymerase sigma-70 factor (ECF subfamily)